MLLQSTQLCNSGLRRVVTLLGTWGSKCLPVLFPGVKGVVERVILLDSPLLHVALYQEDLLL